MIKHVFCYSNVCTQGSKATLLNHNAALLNPNTCTQKANAQVLALQGSITAVFRHNLYTLGFQRTSACTLGFHHNQITPNRKVLNCTIDDYKQNSLSTKHNMRTRFFVNSQRALWSFRMSARTHRVGCTFLSCTISVANIGCTFLSCGVAIEKRCSCNVLSALPRQYVCPATCGRGRVWPVSNRAFE